MRRRRRRTHWEQDRIISCAVPYNMAKNSTCNEQCLVPGFSSTNLDVVPLLTMTIPFQATPQRFPSTMATRRMIFGGMKFESHYSTDPGTWSDSEDCSFPPLIAQFVLAIWEAIVVLPLAQGSTFTPDYLPLIASQAMQGADLGDRLLWKRVMHLPMWGSQTSLGSQVQLEFTDRNSNDDLVVVKARAAVDDRHGVFYVRQFVHNLVVGSDPPCNQPGNIGSCNIPVVNDFYGTMFYRAQGS